MNASILVVDDEVTFLDSVEMMLHMEGFDDVTTVSAPKKAPGLLTQK